MQQFFTDSLLIFLVMLPLSVPKFFLDSVISCPTIFTLVEHKSSSKLLSSVSFSFHLYSLLWPHAHPYILVFSLHQSHFHILVSINTLDQGFQIHARRTNDIFQAMQNLESQSSSNLYNFLTLFLLYFIQYVFSFCEMESVSSLKWIFLRENVYLSVKWLQLWKCKAIAVYHIKITSKKIFFMALTRDEPTFFRKSVMFCLVS